MTTAQQAKTLLAQTKTVSRAIGRLSLAAELKNGAYDTLCEHASVLRALSFDLAFDREPVLAALRLVLANATQWHDAERKNQHTTLLQHKTEEAIDKLESALHSAISKAMSALLAD